MVDLGLSVKWATMNIGATSEEQVGSYFAWGEVIAKDSYDWNTYTQHSKGNINAITKYCKDKNQGYADYLDSLRILEMEDDAANIN